MVCIDFSLMPGPVIHYKLHNTVHYNRQILNPLLAVNLSYHSRDDKWDCLSYCVGRMLSLHWSLHWTYAVLHKATSRCTM